MEYTNGGLIFVLGKRVVMLRLGFYKRCQCQDQNKHSHRGVVPLTK